MARPKGYDEKEAVERVKNLFWKYGYNSVGIRTIEEETGLGRFAIRTQFGGKEGLMEAALAAFSEEANQWVFEPLKFRTDLKALTELLEGLVMPHDGTMRVYGCLATNTAVENVAIGSDSFRNAVNSHFNALAETVRAVVENAKARGELKDDFDVDTAVDFIAGAVRAANLIIREAGDVTAAKGFIERTVQAVNAWSTQKV